MNEQSDNSTYAPISDVAAAYGVSVDTIRRRIRRGDLQGRKEQTPQGFRWLVAMPAPGEPLPGHEIGVAISQPDHAAMVATLQHELAARNSEIERLHSLLEVQARALEAAVQHPALPPSPEIETPESPRSDETGDTGISTPVSAWKRLLRALRGA